MSKRTSRLNIFLKIYEKFGAFKKKHYLCTAFSEGKQVRFLHSPAAVIRNPIFEILKVTGSQ